MQEFPWEDGGAEQLLVLPVLGCAQGSGAHCQKWSPAKSASPPQRAAAHLNLSKVEMTLTFSSHLRQMPKAVESIPAVSTTLVSFSGERAALIS